MSYIFTDQIIEANNINLHCLQYQNSQEHLLMLHGLTANAYAFNGLIQAGLADKWNVLSIDQRGRGKSTKPAFRYSIRDHALDVISLMDKLGIASTSICGHSFGGLMATYLAYHFPKRINKVIILDAAPKMNPKAPQMLMPAISRIDKRYSNFDAYLAQIKASEYLTFWDEQMLPYYLADVATAPDGSVECVSNISDIMQISTHVAIEPWKMYYEGFQQKSLMVVGLDEYTMGEPLMPDYLAKETVKRMVDCRYIEVEGNHQTMLFGEGAKKIVEAINQME
jgi:pimeloyl-ACP methyl ester carboxylesterase